MDSLNSLRTLTTPTLAFIPPLVHAHTLSSCTEPGSVPGMDAESGRSKGEGAPLPCYSRIPALNRGQITRLVGAGNTASFSGPLVPE